jgi:hypothetical protein
LAREADRKFKAAASGRRWASYAIADAVALELAAHLVKLDSIAQEGARAGLLTAQQVADVKALATAAAPIDVLVGEWPAWHLEVFLPLDGLRNDAEWHGAWAAIPRVKAWIDHLLEPTVDPTPMGVERSVEVKKEQAQTEAALKLVAAFLHYAARVGEVREQVRADDPDLMAALDALRDLRERLSADDAQRPTAVVALAPKIDAFRTLVNKLPEPVVTTVAGVEEAIDEDAAAAEAQLAEVLAHLAETTPADVVRMRNDAITTVDRRLIGVIGAVAVWSGLQALYFGKPWGNLIDYGAAIVWAFTGTAVLTPLITILGQRSESRYRLRSDVPG